MEEDITRLTDITYMCELIPHLLFIQVFNFKKLNIKKVRD